MLGRPAVPGAPATIHGFQHRKICDISRDTRPGLRCPLLPLRLQYKLNFRNHLDPPDRRPTCASKIHSAFSTGEDELTVTVGDESRQFAISATFIVLTLPRAVGLMILVCDTHGYGGHKSEVSKTRYQRRSGKEAVHSVSAMLDGEW